MFYRIRSKLGNRFFLTHAPHRLYFIVQLTFTFIRLTLQVDALESESVLPVAYFKAFYPNLSPILATYGEQTPTTLVQATNPRYPICFKLIFH